MHRGVTRRQRHRQHEIIARLCRAKAFGALVEKKYWSWIGDEERPGRVCEGAGGVRQRPTRWRSREAELYQQIQKSREGRELFVLHDGPPFANGDVHMGTALNKILKDFVVKSQTMLGKRAPFVPGWDCHGLPIEYKVVKESRGLSLLEIRKRSEAFARKFVDIQREQFKRLGVFGDWEHPYLTMDPKYEAVILRAFEVCVE